MFVGDGQLPQSPAGSAGTPADGASRSNSVHSESDGTGVEQITPESSTTGAARLAALTPPASSDVDSTAPAMIAAPGLDIVTSVTREGTARFGSVDQMITTEVESTPLVQRLTPQAYQNIRADAREALRPFETPDGQARPPLVGHIVVGRRSR